MIRKLFTLLGLVLAVTLALSWATGTVAQANDIIVCKGSSSTSPVPAGTSFNFTLDGTTSFSLTVGGTCMQFSNVGVGNHTITEDAKSGTVVSEITVNPGDRLVSSNPASRTVTAEAVDDPTPTTVTFVNQQLQPPCDSLCQSCLQFCPGGPGEAAHWCQDHYQECGSQNVGQCVSNAAHNNFVPGCCQPLRCPS